MKKALTPCRFARGCALLLSFLLTLLLYLTLLLLEGKKCTGTAMLNIAGLNIQAGDSLPFLRTHLLETALNAAEKLVQQRLGEGVQLQELLSLPEQLLPFAASLTLAVLALITWLMSKRLREVLRLLGSSLLAQALLLPATWGLLCLLQLPQQLAEASPAYASFFTRWGSLISADVWLTVLALLLTGGGLLFGYRKMR